MKFGLLALLLLVGCEPRVQVGELSVAPGQLRVLDAGGPQGDTGLWPSLALAADDSRHLAYCNLSAGDLYYASAPRAGTRAHWKSHAVQTQGALGKYASLALDSNNQPWIAYYHQDQGELRVAHATQGGWDVEAVAWGLEVGTGGRLMVDAHNSPQLFYYASDGGFTHARRKESGTWEQKTISTASVGPNLRTGLSRTLDGVWLAFIDWNFRTKELVIGEPFGQSHALMRIPLGENAGFGSGLFVDAGEPRVLFVKGGALHLARRVKDGWATERLLPDVGAFDVAQSVNGEVAVAAQDLGHADGRLVLLRRSLLGGWQRFLVDAEGPTADHLSVVLDSKGRTTIAYHAPTIHGLKIYEE